MKLYKFRSNEKHIKEILETDKFYFSKWKKLNDPMEGYYSHYKTEHSKDLTENIKIEKNQWKICSFSEKYDNILLWSFYANGFNGVCIEVEVGDSEDLEKITYNKNIPWLSDNLFIDYQLTGRKIFTNKISKWKFEKEYRYFSRVSLKKIGEITAVILGTKVSEAIKKIVYDYCDDNIKIYDAKINFKYNKVNRIKH
jgi:hypothetical protein